jgi:hypothetical protein
LEEFFYEAVVSGRWSVVSWFDYFFVDIYVLLFKQFKHKFKRKLQGVRAAGCRLLAVEFKYDDVELGSNEFSVRANDRSAETRRKLRRGN